MFCARKEEKMELNKISQYRNAIFGISILSVILFHFTEDYYAAYKAGAAAYNIVINGYYHLIGSIGVEIFIFLSGFGLYYSFSKNNDIAKFYKKRIRRLIVPYIPVGILVWGIWDFVVNQNGVWGFVEDFTFISLFTKGQRGIWFIGVMIILYILFPVLFKIVNRKRAVIPMSILIVGILGVVAGLKIFVPELYMNTEIALMRIPIFIIGIYFGKAAKENKSIPYIVIWAIILCGILGKFMKGYLHMSGYFNRIICIPYGIGVIFLFCMLLNLINSDKFNKILSKIGDYSLELYMTHVGIRKIARGFGVETHRVEIYLLVVLGAVATSFVLHKLSVPKRRKIREMSL